MNILKLSDIILYNKQKHRINRTLEDIVISKNYVMIEPSFFEPYDQLKKMNKNIVNQNTIKVIADDGDILILRPDATTGIMKSLIPKLEDQDVLKLFYQTTIFSKHNEGGIIEKQQFGIEYLGSHENTADLEVINLAVTILKNFKLDYVLEISNNKLIQTIISRMNLNANDLVKFKEIMTYKNKYEFKNFLSTQTFDEDTTAILKMIFNLQGRYQEIEERLLNCPSCQVINEVLKELKMIHDHLGEDDHLTYDLSMMPQFDYYEGLTFKAYIRSSPEPILSGGRYTPLAKAFGKDIGAVGFTLNLNVLIQEVN